ncbi:PhzF family phenazine biosynthesis protein [Porticoccus sp.]
MKTPRGLTMDFPAAPLTAVAIPEHIEQGLGQTPMAAFAATDLMLVFASEQQIIDLAPDFRWLAQLSYRGIIATAPGTACDFVSRFFAPACGIDEDPVTGSAHCALTPYWAAKLGKQLLSARQLSRRGGALL